MSRGLSIHGYTGFSFTIDWECGACGARGDFGGSADEGEVSEHIDHSCEVDDE